MATHGQRRIRVSESHCAYSAMKLYTKTAMKVRTAAMTPTIQTAIHRGTCTRSASRPRPAVYRLSTLLAVAPQMTTSRNGTRYQPGRIFGRLSTGLDMSTSVASTAPTKPASNDEVSIPRNAQKATCPGFVLGRDEGEGAG